MAAKKKSRKTPSPAAPEPAAPVDPVVAECLQLLARFKELIGPVTAMKPSEVRRSVKLHKGSAFVIEKIMPVCRQHGMVQVGAVTLAGMEATWARATALRMIGVALYAAEKELRDATFQANRDTWSSALVFYSSLRRAAKVDPMVQESIAQIAEFFKEKRRKKARPKPRGSG